MKYEMREKYKNIRNNIKNRDVLNKKIFLKVINNQMIMSAKTILTYVSMDSEVDTIEIIKYFLSSKRIAVPKIQDGEMNFYYIDSIDDLKVGYFNILEPTTDSVVTDFNDTVSLTPGICFSEDLYRIGYGGGYYDKFYQKHNVYSIGLCYKKCLVKKIPNNQYDKKVNEIITD